MPNEYVVQLSDGRYLGHPANPLKKTSIVALPTVQSIYEAWLMPEAEAQKVAMVFRGKAVAVMSRFVTVGEECEETIAYGTGSHGVMWTTPSGKKTLVCVATNEKRAEEIISELKRIGGFIEGSLKKVEVMAIPEGDHNA